MNFSYLLEVKNLGCTRQGRQLITSLSFTLTNGDLLHIAGTNGSGKSSLMRLLAGIASPTSGDIFWQGQSLRETRDHYISEVNYLGHDNGMKPGLTLIENLTLASHLQPASFLFSDILSQLGLDSYHHTPVRYLSAGQQRKVALIRLWLSQKKIWLMDEPLTALDDQTQQLFLDRLKKHLLAGGIGIISSHQPFNIEIATFKTVKLT